MKCTNCRGHRWSTWRKFCSGPREEKDGKIYRQELQKRRCSRCGFSQTEWISVFYLALPAQDKESGA